MHSCGVATRPEIGLVRRGRRQSVTECTIGQIRQIWSPSKRLQFLMPIPLVEGIFKRERGGKGEGVQGRKANGGNGG